MIGKRGYLRVKILVIVQNTKDLLNFRAQLLMDFVKAGNQVTACAPENDPDLVEKISKMGITFIQIPLERAGMNLIKDLFAIIYLVKTVSQINPDIVFNISMKPGIYGTLASRWARVPKVYSLMTGLGFAFLTTNLRGYLINKLVCFMGRFAFPKNNKIFFQNPDDLSQFVKLKLVRKAQAVLVNGSGVDLKHYSPAPIVEKGPVFLLISRLIKDKGVIEYVEAARILKNRHNEVTFCLLGPFDSNPTALSRSQIESWHREGVIDYCGETKDVRPFISASSIYVLPSYREGIPRSVLEAMSMGRPIITTDAPGCRETVIMSKNGFLVPVKNVHALAEAMERFIVNPNLIKEMGQCSRELAVEKFDVNEVNNKIMKEMGLINEK
jgi:glycosyltransferase involved in cell wall biosynthesis